MHLRDRQADERLEQGIVGITVDVLKLAHPPCDAGPTTSPSASRTPGMPTCGSSRPKRS